MSRMSHLPGTHRTRFSFVLAALVATVLAATGYTQAPAPQAPAAAPAAAAPAAASPAAQAPKPRPKPNRQLQRRVLVLGAALGWQHESIPDGMAMVYNLGRETGMWESWLRTDFGLMTKKNAGVNAKNLDQFDALVFVNTTGEMPLDDQQKQDLLAFVRDEGKGFVGIHAALDANYKWPEYGEMIGGWFDEHPWNTFDAPVVREDADFPATRHFPLAFLKYDEIYQAKAWARDKCNVLLRLDETKLKYENEGPDGVRKPNTRVHRADRDFGVAWSKMYGKGRVFYSTFGHTPESFSDPDIKTMYAEAIKWALGLTEGSTTPHAKK
jgi:type 1 glutamine amidotransferase